MFSFLKEKIRMFFSRLWVRMLYYSYPVQSSVEPPSDEDMIKQFAENKVPKGLAIFGAFLFALFILYYAFIMPPADFASNKIITIPEKTNLTQIAEILQENKIIKSATFFAYYTRLTGKSKQLKYGDYMFKKPINVFKVAYRIYKGEYGLEPVVVRIPEGYSVYEIADILEKKLYRFDKEKFLNIAKEYEGRLFPDTYHFLPNIKEDKIVQTMTKNFESKIAKLDKYIKKMNKPLDDIIKMASIVEKESWIHADRRKIAGVLWTRLKIGMPLQVDATFVYTHKKGSSQITLKELQDKDNPYNTYIHKGLPPTPIGNPGYYAILATVTPIYDGSLFYLADKTGKTHFSKTYAEHMRKRSIYINWSNAKKQKQ